MAAPKELSFELHEDMIGTIAREFSPADIAKKLAEACQGKTLQEAESAGERIFTEYGEKWARRTVELGDSYMDRTYEILKESLEATGSPPFPLLPQRFIEIAYLSTQELSTFPVMENNVARIIFRIENCKTYREITEACGEETAKILTCRHGCLKLCGSIMEELRIEGVAEEISARTPEDGYCEFTLRNTAV